MYGSLNFVFSRCGPFLCWAAFSHGSADTLYPTYFAPVKRHRCCQNRQHSEQLLHHDNRLPCKVQRHSWEQDARSFSEFPKANLSPRLSDNTVDLRLWLTIYPCKSCSFGVNIVLIQGDALEKENRTAAQHIREKQCNQTGLGLNFGAFIYWVRWLWAKAGSFLHTSAPPKNKNHDIHQSDKNWGKHLWVSTIVWPHNRDSIINPSIHIKNIIATLNHTTITNTDIINGD